MTKQEYTEWVRNHALCSECRWPDVPMNQSACKHCHNKECWEPKARKAAANDEKLLKGG